MKQKSINSVVMLVSLILSAMLLCSVAVAASVTEFSDVPTDYWGYQTIMEMTKAGLFKGTAEPINGVGIFSPEKEMTRAEFITASLRAIYPDESKSIENGSTKWWDNYYSFALQKGIVKETELNGGELDEPMTREEMAMVMVRCVENNGEKLTQRIKASQIPDYSKIGNYFKDYVLDCFSLGLLCGVDANGTFAPIKSLTRAEATTVLCRLIEEDMRVDVEFIKDTNTNSGINNGGGNNQGNTNIDNENTPSVPEQDEHVEIPWENGGKQPSEYTWEEYEALPETVKNSFYESFENETVFEEWFNRVQGTQNSGNDLPWENGGKQPSEYTWEEYEALPETVKNLFYESFENETAFEEWFNRVQGTQNSGKDLPWENGGKQPSEYTWEEYEALPETVKNSFYESFENETVFEEWFNKVQGTQNSENDFPWGNGGKQPSEYTWEEFDALSDKMKENFVNSFDKPGDFADWLNANQP